MIRDYSEWIPLVIDLCFDFLKRLEKCPGCKYLRFEEDRIGTIENPGIIINEFNKDIFNYSHEIIVRNIEQYHLVAAFYIRSILKYKLFSLNIQEETKQPQTCLYTEYPNEFFIIPFLEFIFKAYKDKDAVLNMDRNSKAELISELLSYNGNNFPAHTFSTTIRQIEKDYFKREL